MHWNFVVGNFAVQNFAAPSFTARNFAIRNFTARNFAVGDWLILHVKKTEPDGDQVDHEPGNQDTPENPSWNPTHQGQTVRLDSWWDLITKDIRNGDGPNQTDQKQSQDQKHLATALQELRVEFPAVVVKFWRIVHEL